MVIDPSIVMLPVSCEQLLSLAGLFFGRRCNFTEWVACIWYGAMVIIRSHDNVEWSCWHHDHEDPWTLIDWSISSFICMIIDWNDHRLTWSLIQVLPCSLYLASSYWALRVYFLEEDATSLNGWQAFDMGPWWLSGCMIMWSDHVGTMTMKIHEHWLIDRLVHSFAWSLTGMTTDSHMSIDPSIAMLPVSCEQLLSLAGLFLC